MGRMFEGGGEVGGRKREGEEARFLKKYKMAGNAWIKDKIPCRTEVIM